MNQNYGAYGSQQMNTQPMMNQQGGMSGMNFPQHQGFQQGGAGGGGGGGMMTGGPMQRTPDYMQSGGPCIQGQQRGIGPQRPYLQVRFRNQKNIFKQKWRRVVVNIYFGFSKCKVKNFSF